MRICKDVSREIERGRYEGEKIVDGRGKMGKEVDFSTTIAYSLT